MVKPKVARMWRGRTRESMADAYEKYHYEEGVKKLRGIPGNLGVQVLRQVKDGIATFTTISYWGSLREIEAYAGSDIGKPHHLPRDAEFLLELPTRVEHFDVLQSEWASDGGT